MKLNRDITAITRISITVIFMLCIPGFQGLSQSKPKPKEAAPTQKEVDEMMREMQREMDNMSDDDKKVLDSMGLKMPSLNEIPKFTDQQLAEAYENESRIVPKKNTARISSISKTPLTDAATPSFLAATHARVTTTLSAEVRTKGEEIHRLIMTQYNSPAATGNAAAGLWMLGRTRLALYVMGKACLDDPANTDNMNNYAAMLSMSGGEERAIPLLERLNRRFRKNSTILNNLGQAWFGLGELDKANAYLDSAIRIYAYHPQANYTKSFIEESKGNTKGAVEAMKRSVKKAYSPEKENRLSKLGYKLKSGDLSWNHPMPQDPLGLEKFNWPEYPKNVSESEVLKKDWDLFKASCRIEIEKLTVQQKRLEQEMLTIQQMRVSKLLKAGQNGQSVNPMPPMAAKATVKLKYLVDGRDGQLANNYEKKVERLADAYQQTGALEEKLWKQLDAIRQKYEDKFGEGKPNPFDAACSDENAAKNSFLTESNAVLEKAANDFLDFHRKKTNDEMYYYQYTMWPEVFELAKVTAKISWLNLIRDQKIMFQDKSSWCREASQQKEKPFKLADFDDVHCEYHSKLTTPVGTIRTDCSRMTSELDLKFIKLGLKQDMNKETFGDQFMSCSVEVGAGVSVGSRNLGPIKAEASIGGAIGVEIDRTGITDVILKGAAGISVGTDIIKDGSDASGMKVGTDTKDGSAGDVGVIKDLQLEVGVKGQVSIVSGKSSGGGTGLFEGNAGN